MIKCILIVEDQEDLRTILRDLPKASGCDTVEAVDGGEGVAQARLLRPDLIALDIIVIAASSFAVKGDEGEGPGIRLRRRHHALLPRNALGRDPGLRGKGASS
jgi:DNA-binding NarL/FixJ family response regulator